MAWSDYTDWTSIDTVRLTAPLDGILPVIKAVNERCPAAGIALITETARLDAIAAISTIQSKVTQLIPLFVNQTVSGGDYTGLSAIPMWTEADILTAIGAVSRIAAPASIYELSVEWLYQQYLILNKLVWRKTRTGSTTDNSGYLGALGTGYSLSMETAVDNAIARIADWTHYQVLNMTQAYGGSGDPILYGGQALSEECKFVFSTVLGNTINSTADSYYLASNNTFGSGRDTFDGSGIAIEGMNFIETLPTQQISAYTTPLIGDKNQFPVYPATPLAGTATSRGFLANYAYLVSKFNVTGGFEYV